MHLSSYSLVYMVQGMLILQYSFSIMKLTVFERTTQAQRWVAAGYKSLDDLLNKAKLSYSQRIGVEHYDVSHASSFLLQ